MSKNLLDGPKEYKKDIDNIDKILYKILDDIKKQTVFLSSQNVDRLISLGEVVGDDWEIIENERCDEITFSEGDLNLIELAQAPKTSNKKSKQDTSLFKVRYQYAGAKKGERDFCNKVIEADKVYREEDLNANYNYNEELSPSGTDSYNIFLFKGGVNCKHWWQRVVYLKKGNDRISVNQAKKMILELDPKDRKEASFDKNDKRVAQVAEAQNNYWSLTPDYRDSGVELSAKSKELYQRLAEETYNDYPQSATNNAKRALKYKEENGSDCGTQVGWTRAGQLARREKLTRDTIARMASFKRHQQHKDVPYSEGCGGIMFDAWGGTSGVEWAIRKLKQIDKK